MHVFGSLLGFWGLETFRGCQMCLKEFTQTDTAWLISAEGLFPYASIQLLSCYKKSASFVCFRKLSPRW